MRDLTTTSFAEHMPISISNRASSTVNEASRRGGGHLLEAQPRIYEGYGCKGIQVKILIAGLLIATFSAQTSAAPGAAIVDTCLRTESTSLDIIYSPIKAASFEVIEDKPIGTTTTLLRYETDSVGTWERAMPPTFGLVFNGRKTPLARVVRLDKKKALETFNPYEAIWGLARDDKGSYICATFNFDGLGKSGSFQNVRGLYLIERGKHARGVFYTYGDIRKIK